MKTYSMYDSSGSVLVDKVDINEVVKKLPAGARLVSGNTFNKDGSIKEIKSVFKIPNGTTIEIIENK